MQHISTAKRYTSPLIPARAVSRSSCSFILESQLHRRIEHPAFTAQWKGYRCIAHRRAEQIERLRIPAQHAILIREPVRPNTRVIRTAILTEDVRPARIQLQRLLDRHHRKLELVARVVTPRKSRRSCACEIVKPPPETFTLERPPVIFETTIERNHLVTQCIHRGPRLEEVRRKDHAAVREPNLRILKRVLARLLLRGLRARRIVACNPR